MSIHSNDGTSWETKLDRISELSAANRNLVFNNLGHLVNKPLLKGLYHELSGEKAVGIDHVTKTEYGLRLDENLDELIFRIRRGTYQPKAARLVEIPKEDGSTRPLAISCVEDKLVQLAANEILTRIYEPLFLPCSYGFRANKSCHDALRTLAHSTYNFQNGAVAEIDVRKYFNSIPHENLLNFLQKKIADKRFLRLIGVLLKSPVLQGGEALPNNLGCPQGSCFSPILANIYLHEVIDTWFEEIKKSHLRGQAELIRYADDMVFSFQHMSDAERFYRVLPKRFEKFGLALHEDKSQLLPSGHKAMLDAQRRGERLSTYKFLGFVCYWGKARNGMWRLKYSSRGDRFRTKLKEIKQFLRNSLNAADTGSVIDHVVRIVRGWINYHGVSDNERRVREFILENKRLLHLWFNRRGGNRYVRWDKVQQILVRHKYPEQWKRISMFQRS